jgi:hypothetical protein
MEKTAILVVIGRDSSIVVSHGDDVDLYMVDLRRRSPGEKPVRLPDTEVFHDWAATCELIEDEDISFRDDLTLSERDALAECILELESVSRVLDTDRGLKATLARAQRAYSEAR